jgi:hypothetical protein
MTYNTYHQFSEREGSLSEIIIHWEDRAPQSLTFNVKPSGPSFGVQGMILGMGVSILLAACFIYAGMALLVQSRDSRDPAIVLLIGLLIWVILSLGITTLLAILGELLGKKVCARRWNRCRKFTTEELIPWLESGIAKSKR